MVKAMGGLLKINNAATIKVEGILDNISLNTDFPISRIVSYETMKQYAQTFGYNTDWGRVTGSFQAFMLLPKNVNASTFSKQLLAFSNEHFNADKKDVFKTYEFLQPLSDIHFNTSMGNFGDHSTSPTILWTLSLIGVFIIIMACINFINLSTAQAGGRSKEVGIKKVMGVTKTQLCRQLMGETFIIVATAVIIAIIIAIICLPSIKQVASIQEVSIFNIPVILFLIIITILVTLLSGAYPNKSLIAFSHVLLNAHTATTLKSFEDKVAKFPEVMECFQMTGTFDFILRIATSDMDAYHEFYRNKLAMLPNITTVQSFFVLSETKSVTEYPV